ncbi:hypothetical protein Ancab_020545 [Ancistrocladus abbreviatus]
MPHKRNTQPTKAGLRVPQPRTEHLSPWPYCSIIYHFVSICRYIEVGVYESEMRLKRKLWKEALPFIFMVLMEGCTSALGITSNWIMEKVMNQFVYVAYSSALSSFILLPYTRLFHKERISIAQNLAFTGVHYSTPIVACGIGLLLPSFQFILALVLSGETAMDDLHLTYCTALDFGYILLLVATFFLAVWNILQVSTIRRLPDTMLIVTCYIVFGTVQTAAVDIVAERNLTAWKLKLDLELLITVLTAIFGTLGRSRVQAWCMNLKGPIVLGAVIAGMGYYTVLWGVRRADKEETQLEKPEALDSNSDLKAPLLRQQDGDHQV